MSVRLETLILELERQHHDTLIVAHPTVIRCLYAYFSDIPESLVPFVSVPARTLIKVVPKAYGTLESQILLSDEPLTIFENKFCPHGDK